MGDPLGNALKEADRLYRGIDGNAVIEGKLEALAQYNKFEACIVKAADLLVRAGEPSLHGPVNDDKIAKELVDKYGCSEKTALGVAKMALLSVQLSKPEAIICKNCGQELPHGPQGCPGPGM